jgi:hypothetical protein
VDEYEARSHQKIVSKAIHGPRHSSVLTAAAVRRLSRDSLAKNGIDYHFGDKLRSAFGYAQSQSAPREQGL